MPNFAAQLKSEIQRLARKETRSEISSLRKSVATYRVEIAALKRRLSELEAIVKKLSKPTAAKKVESNESSALRWRAPGFSSLRKKIGLSAADMGKLLGVAGATVYSWEAGKTKPRASQMAAIARVRQLGKRAAAEMLSTLK
jgi:DNA-binding transcriptional regulator YiaG